MFAHLELEGLTLNALNNERGIVHVDGICYALSRSLLERSDKFVAVNSVHLQYGAALNVVVSPEER